MVRRPKCAPKQNAPQGVRSSRKGATREIGGSGHAPYANPDRLPSRVVRAHGDCNVGTLPESPSEGTKLRPRRIGQVLDLLPVCRSRVYPKSGIQGANNSSTKIQGSTVCCFNSLTTYSRGTQLENSNLRHESDSNRPCCTPLRPILSGVVMCANPKLAQRHVSLPKTYNFPCLEQKCTLLVRRC